MQLLLLYGSVYAIVVAAKIRHDGGRRTQVSALTGEAALKDQP